MGNHHVIQKKAAALAAVEKLVGGVWGGAWEGVGRGGAAEDLGEELGEELPEEELVEGVDRGGARRRSLGRSWPARSSSEELAREAGRS
jgi:hypothetical protein